MRIFAPLLIAFSIVGLGACNSTSGTSTPQASSLPYPSASATSSASARYAIGTPTSAEAAWMRQICLLENEFADNRANLPGAYQSVASLTLGQRKSRVEVLYAADVALVDAHVASLDKIPPPASGQGLQTVLRASHEADAVEERRSLHQIDEIFVAAQTVEANNGRLQAIHEASAVAINAELNRNHVVGAMYAATPECQVDRA